MTTILWTDRRSRASGTVLGPEATISELYGWWRDNGRQLGRPLEDPVTASPSPGASVPPLVRVPGRPDAIVCDASSEPIIDLGDRTWRVQRIRFQNNPLYERVIIQLERTGRNRTDADTQVTVERFPISQLKDRMPNAPRPSRGGTILRIRMQGVNDAPNIRAFQPSGTGFVRELSVVKGKGMRSAVLSVAQGACYQVRVPIWGPSADGDERTASIFVDVRR
jgi:hypothetical protein